MGQGGFGRRVWLTATALLALTAVAPCFAEEMTAPANIQARILTLLVANERNFAKRASHEVVIHLVEVPGDHDSQHAVQQMRAKLADMGDLDGRRIQVEIVQFADAQSLVASSRAKNVNALYISPGMGNHVAAIARALGGTGILSFAAVESYVQLGAVVGVSIISGRPKMSINLAQARSQGLDIPSAILALAKVY